MPVKCVITLRPKHPFEWSVSHFMSGSDGELNTFSTMPLAALFIDGQQVDSKIRISQSELSEVCSHCFAELFGRHLASLRKVRREFVIALVEIAQGLLEHRQLVTRVCGCGEFLL